MCTGAGDVLAHHRRLDRAAGVLADGEHAVVLHEHRRRAVAAAASRRRRADVESSPISANGPTGISPPNSSAIIVSTHGIGLAARGPRRRVRRVGVHDAADLGQVPVDVGVRGGVRRRRVVALDDLAVEVG